MRKVSLITQHLLVRERIADPKRDRLVAIVHGHCSGLGCRDGFRARRGVSAVADRELLNVDRKRRFFLGGWVDCASRIRMRIVYTTAGAGQVRVLEVGEFNHELAVAEVCVLCQNIDAPTGRASIKSRWGHSLAAEYLTGVGIAPLRAFGLKHQTGIQTDLLMSRGTKVIVCEYRAQRSINIVVVERVVRVPPLNGSLRPKRPEEGMRLGIQLHLT